jgi:hypothetical protein
MSVVEEYVHCRKKERKKERKKDDIIRRINYSKYSRPTEQNRVNH